MDKASPDKANSVSRSFRMAFAGRYMRDIVREIAGVFAGDALARFGSAGVKANLSLPVMAPGNEIAVVGNERMHAVGMRFEGTDNPSWKKVVAGPPHNSQPRID